MRWSHHNFPVINSSGLCEPDIIYGTTFIYGTTGGLSWTWADQSPDGGVKFSANVEILPTLSAEYVDMVFLRSVALFLLSKLNEKSLKDAVDSLIDIHKWQIKSEHVKVPESSARYIGAFIPRTQIDNLAPAWLQAAFVA
jgi:hypothetical protein